MNENPTVRQVCNLLATIAFLCLLAFVAQTHAISTASLETILIAFTVGTSIVKLPKALALGFGRLLIDAAVSGAAASGESQRRMAAVRPPPTDPPEPGPHDRTTTQVPQQRPRDDGRYRGPGQLRALQPLQHWAPALLAGMLGAAVVTIAVLANAVPPALAGGLP